MATPIIFNNGYASGFWGYATPTITPGEFSVLPEPIFSSSLKGAINSPGDAVEFQRRTQFGQFYATQYDNNNSIILSDRSGNYYYFANTSLGVPLGSSLTVRYGENTLGDYQPLCFVTGTKIRTSRGEVAVEDLQVGDRAVTVSGAMRSIVWIGYRDLDAGAGLLPISQQPVRVRHNAFGPGIPARDLSLSPGHPILIGADEGGKGGALVPIMYLINGTTILRASTHTVAYWHIELDAHDVLLAEGLPAESYYDMGSRAWFAGEDGALVNPDFVPAGSYGRCRPVMIDGPVVEAERVRLSGVFSSALSEACAWEEAESFPWLTAFT